MDLIPVNDKVLVKPDPKEEKTSGGLVIPGKTTLDDAPVYGTVMAVSEGRRSKTGTLIPLGVKKGDRILYNSYADGQWVKVENIKYIILSEEHILGIEEDK